MLAGFESQLTFAVSRHSEFASWLLKSVQLLHKGAQLWQIDIIPTNYGKPVETAFVHKLSINWSRTLLHVEKSVIETVSLQWVYS